MEQSYDFFDKLALSGRIEQRIMYCLRALSMTVSIEDVTHDANYQKKGVDIVWRAKKGIDTIVEADFGVEVKADEKMYQTGNFFFETVSNEERGTPGWLLYSEADYLAYVSVPQELLYWIFFQPVKKWVVENREQFYEARTGTRGESGNVLYHTKGLLVPKKVLFDEKGNCVREIKID